MGHFLKNATVTLDIIIPVLNGESFLPKALNSIDNLNSLPDQIIFLDNCSSDNTSDIIKRWAEDKPFVEIHRNSQVLSFADNWNTALKLAKSEFVHFLAFDDELHPGFVNNVKTVARKYRHATGMVFRVNIFDEKRKHLSKKLHLPIEYQVNARKFLKLLISNNSINLAGAVFRREEIARLGFMDKRYSIWPDWILWQNILMYGTIVRSFRIASTYRIHSTTQKQIERRNLVEQDLSTMIQLQLPLIFDFLEINPSKRTQFIAKLKSRVRSQASFSPLTSQ